MKSLSQVELNHCRHHGRLRRFIFNRRRFTYKRGARIITGRKEIEAQLQSALGKVKLLSGVLPSCASCKKIQDAKGQWHVLEEYIRSHNEADLTHGLCPDCTEKFWPTPHLSPGL